MPRKQTIDRSYMVLARNPDTGKAAQMTRKAFDGIYADKGFELIDRDNVDEVFPDRSDRRTGRELRDGLAGDDGSGEPAGQETGTAASIANKLNLGEGGGKNEKRLDTKGTVSEDRKPSGRDRGSR